MRIQNNVSSGTAVDVSSAAEKATGDHIDYRLLENRKEGFLQWWVASTAALDVDPSMWMMNYLNARFEHSVEERLWFAWLFHTYCLPTSWAFKQEFPDEELASVERFESFVAENFSRIRHERDCKWSRGHLAAMYSSYHDFVGKSTQQEKFTRMCQGTPDENFWLLWDTVKENFFKFGRYTTFFYLQTLKATCGLPIECPTLFLEDFKGSQSHRNGLILAAGKDDWVDQKLSKEEYMWLEGFGQDLITEAKTRWPNFAEQFDTFTIETCLCSYKKVFRTANGRYVNYYNDRVSDQIRKAESDGWYGIEWNVLHQCRAESSNGRLQPSDTIDKEKMKRFLEQGDFHLMYQS